MHEQGAHVKAKMEETSVWNVEKATWEKYRNVVRACRDAMRKTKAHLELHLVKKV